MSSITKKEQAAFKESEAKLFKFLKVVKKFISKEFLWVLFIFILALPLALIIVYGIEKYTSKIVQESIIELLDGNPLFIGSYVFSIGGIYFSRMVVGAIKTLVEKPIE